MPIFAALNANFSVNAVGRLIKGDPGTRVTITVLRTRAPPPSLDSQIEEPTPASIATSPAAAQPSPISEPITAKGTSLPAMERQSPPRALDAHARTLPPPPSQPPAQQPLLLTPVAAQPAHGAPPYQPAVDHHGGNLDVRVTGDDACRGHRSDQRGELHAVIARDATALV